MCARDTLLVLSAPRAPAVLSLELVRMASFPVGAPSLSPHEQFKAALAEMQPGARGGVCSENCAATTRVVREDAAGTAIVECSESVHVIVVCREGARTDGVPSAVGALADFVLEDER